MYISVNGFQLPREIERDSDYVKDLHDYLETYKKYVCSELIGQCVENIEKNIEVNIQLIEECLSEYFKDNVSKAYTAIKNLLTEYISKENGTPFVVATLNSNYAFRGSAPKEIRSSIYSKCDTMYEEMLNHELTFFRTRIAKENIKGKDMLHIPFNKREMIKTQRFSISGIPCIYLSTSSYGCWIEMNRPDSKSFQVSSIKIPTDIKVLNLCIQQNLINGKMAVIQNTKEWKEAIQCLEIFPLVIATSYHVKQNDRSFKSEYIIPQIVMQVCGELGIKGIAYLSKKVEDKYAYPYAVNLAIPIPSNDCSEYWDRIDDVEITEPVRFSDFLSDEGQNKKSRKKYLSYSSEIYKDNYSNKIWLEEEAKKYIETEYAAFDEYVLEQEFKKFTQL